MAVIGIELESDTLVLTQNRDFKWSFDNLDENGEAVDFPAGELFLEFQTGGQHNAKQTITILRAADGTYILTLGAAPTASIPWDASAFVVQNALEAIPAIGAGNVKVTGTYVPQWIVEVDWTSPVELSPGVVQTFNDVINDVFDALEGLGAGKVDLNGVYSSSSFTLTVTYRGSLLEEEIVDAVFEAVDATIDTALDAVEMFTGNIADVTEFYAPKRVLKVEFIGDLAETPVAALVPTSSLTGSSPTIAVQQTAPGKDPVTIWSFDIEDANASLFVEHEDANAMPARTVWQLVFLPDGEAAGGDPIATGTVRRQGAAR